MHLKMIKQLTSVALFIASLTCIQSSHAALVMMLDDPNDSNAATYIYDSSAADTNNSVGAISFIGSVGKFSINVSTGLSKPLLDNGTLDLNSINVTGNEFGTLILGISDTDFTGNISGLNASYGGTSDNSVKFNFLYDNSNTEFGGSSFANGDFIATTGNIAFDKDIAAVINNTGTPYSLSIIAEINHTNPHQTTSFDAFISPTTTTVPEPAPLGLLLAGLTGCYFKRRKHAAK